MEKRLYRSRTDRMIAGVCGGLGEYFGIDPVIVRIVFVLIALANGIGLLAYLILWVIVPVKERVGATPEEVMRENIESIRTEAERLRDEVKETIQGAEMPRPVRRGEGGAVVAGAILIALGVIFLLGNLNFFWWLGLGHLWPLILVAIGIVLLINTMRGER